MSELSASTETNCTRITSCLHGLTSSVTIPDKEIEQVAIYVAVEEAKGMVVTTERGNWID